MSQWTCSTCSEIHEGQFAACWKCGGKNPGPVEPPPETIVQPVATSAPQPQPDPLQCPRCPTPLKFVGTRKFHEGARWGLLGDLGELFVNRESFDIYVCPRCGRVEFFIDGIGEELRRK